MKARDMPEGFEKVLQFNVYMRGGEGRDPLSDIKYTVADTYVPRDSTRDPVDLTPRQGGQPGGYKDRSVEDLSPEDVGDIKSFLNRVKSETGDNDTRRTYPQEPRNATMEETMFKPRIKDRPEYIGEMTQEKTPDRGGYDRKPKESPEGDYYLRNEPANYNQRPSPSYPEEGRSPYPREEARPSDKWDDNPRDKDEDRYLEIFVRPKRGQDKLVYREDGKPAEFVHKFTPKKDYDRYNQEPEERVPQKRVPDDIDYRNEYRKPELYVPTSSHKKYVPRNDDDDLRSANQPANKRGSAMVEIPKEPYRERPEDARTTEYDAPRVKSHSSGAHSNYPIPPEEANVKYSRVDGPKAPTADAEQVYSPPPRDKSRKPYYPEDQRYDDRKPRDTRGRYPDDLVDRRKPPTDEPMTDDERKRYQERQKELIEALYNEKNALKELVDRLCHRLDTDQPPRREPYEYEQPPRPREEYVNVPARRSISPAPRQDWHPGPYKNPRDRNEVLARSERKSPFDVDKHQGKTEWEIKEPYLKQYDKIQRSPTRNVDPAPREYSRSPVPNRYERTAPPRVNTYSPVKDSPKTGDEFCGLCDVYLDKDKYRNDTAQKARNPSVHGFNQAGNSPGT